MFRNKNTKKEAKQKRKFSNKSNPYFSSWNNCEDKMKTLKSKALLGLAALIFGIGGCLSQSPEGKARMDALGSSMIYNAANTWATESVKKGMGHRDYRQEQANVYTGGGREHSKYKPGATYIDKYGLQWVKKRDGFWRTTTPDGQMMAVDDATIESWIRKR
jgi:hypothetical protein